MKYKRQQQLRMQADPAFIAAGQDDYTRRCELLEQVERLCAALGQGVPRAPVWTLDPAHAGDGRHYSLPLTVARLRKEMEG